MIACQHLVASPTAMRASRAGYIAFLLVQELLHRVHQAAQVPADGPGRRARAMVRARRRRRTSAARNAQQRATATATSTHRAQAPSTWLAITCVHLSGLDS